MRFCKRILKVPQITSNSAIRSEFGRLPIINKLLQQTISYYARLESMNENRLAKTIYHETKNNQFSIHKIANHYNETVALNTDNVYFRENKQKRHYIQTFKDTFLSHTEEEWSY